MGSITPRAESPPPTAHYFPTLLNKTALVTGSGRGIGAGIALSLGQRGARVIVHYNASAKAANALVATLKTLGTDAIALQADITKVSEIKRLFEEAVKWDGKGGLDIVASNSGVESFNEAGEAGEEDWERVFGLNAKAQFFVAQEAYKTLRRGGRLILMSSVAATMSGIPNHALYAGSKAAVEAFTRSFSADCGKIGVTVNAIAPGGVKSDMYTENSWHYAPGGYKGMPQEDIDKGLASLCPLKRVAVPEDIGNVVAFLASNESEWINGQVLLLSGGSIT